MSWKEYHLTNKGIEDWLPWGALTHESVLHNKDDSMLGIIRYQRFCPRGEEAQRIALPAFRQGWCLWIEEQYAPTGTAGDEEACFLVLCWNPFYKRDAMVRNTMDGKPIPLDKAEEALAALLDSLAGSFPPSARASVLVYQEIIDYLTFSLTMGRKHAPMPDPPIDLDIQLTDGIDLDFSANHVRLAGETYLVLTLPAEIGSSGEAVRHLRTAFADAGIPFRHVQRLLLYDAKSAKKELQGYMGRWCPSRRYIKDMLQEGLLQSVNGLYNHQMIFLVPEDERGRVEAYLTQAIEAMRLPYIIEDFNAKDLWWGSLPGLFRAALFPPICGFSGLCDLLAQSGGREEETDVQTEPV